MYFYEILFSLPLDQALKKSAGIYIFFFLLNMTKCILTPLNTSLLSHAPSQVDPIVKIRVML